ncbi:MAG: hypothetical protein JO145_13230 [Acidobacteriaceae bacterium]|nr:hypothetical protein [Acidobacteriaceae bacterium]
MRVAMVVLVLALAGHTSRAADTSDATYGPLWLYNGAWQVTQDGKNPEELKNECALVGIYFACQQIVNGKPSELLIFVPANKPGHYYTQSVMPQGRAGGRGDLEISGDRWTYTSTWDEGGKTTYYRTTNVFTGKTRIHFEQAESSNNKDWKVTSSGDEVHISGGPMKVAH